MRACHSSSSTRRKTMSYPTNRPESSLPPILKLPYGSWRATAMSRRTNIPNTHKGCGRFWTRPGDEGRFVVRTVREPLLHKKARVRTATVGIRVFGADGIQPVDARLTRSVGESERAVDQRQVRQRLREVADQPLCTRVVLLAQQPHVVTQREQPLEELFGLALAADAPQRLDQPEAADQERSLVPGKAVVGFARAVAQDEAVFGQLVSYRLDGAYHPLVVVGQEPDARDEQRACVERVGTIRLCEGSSLGVVALLQDFVVDLVAHGPPTLHGSLEPEALHASDQGVKRHPAHDLGVDEVLPWAARLPDPVVRPLPAFFQTPREPVLQPPTPLHGDDPGRAAHVRSPQHLARDVALDLAGGVVADADGGGALISWEPGQFVLGQAAGAVYGVHDLRVGGVAGDGPEHPLLPGVGFAEQAGSEKCT